MARLNETSKDAHDQGAQNDTQTIPAESHLEYGDFENDDDLTEAEKATIRQKFATRKRQVTFGRGDGQGNSEDEGNDVNAAERRRQSCRQSLKKAVKPADKTSIELGYDDDTDDMYLRFYGIHDNDEREILADMRNVDDFTACIAEHAESVFGHLADLLSQIAEQAEQLDQAHNEARVQQEAADARVERAQTQARAAAADELAQVTQKCNRMITTKNSYASRLAVLEDELAASRESNVKLYSQISDLYNERSVLQQHAGVPTNGNLYDTRPAQFQSSPPPMTANPFIGTGTHDLMLPPPMAHHQKNRPLARSAVSDNLTATGAKLKDIDIFRGDSTDKEDYKYWRRSARNFLNKTTIHTTVQDQLDYLIDHLRGPAAAQVEYRAAPGARNAYVTAEEVLTELDRIFDTVDKVTEASAALHDSGSGGLKQRDNESFNTWVARFTSTVAPLNLGDNEMIQHAIRLMKFGRNAGLQFRHGDTWEAFAQNCRTQQQLSRLTQSSGNNGTANVSGKKHRPTDADVPAACKSGSIVPASRVPALKATFTNAALQATVVDATDESEN
ncbi:KfrA-N domain containing protein [Pyrenophora tritici-repentis]|uniref:KfrA-N domain containing protein n=1 Tax=Pyrenophora tritici-repentis TaxID=45151 RepID=A0A317AMP9_9PLEO|nr:KfrA-N domain containing protein [Pyrenophora tritici-repentis]